MTLAQGQLSPADDSAALWQRYHERRNERVPIAFACDDQTWLKVSGHSFGQFYADPRVHLQAQLEGKRWLEENVPGDMERGGDHWSVGVQLWMEEDAFFGCEVIYQEDDYAWAKPLPLSKADLLAHLRDIDPGERLRHSRLLWMYEHLRDLAEGMEFAGRPVRVQPPGRGTHGLFTKAAEVRGLEAICLDMGEDPGFVLELMDVMTEKTLARMQAWARLTGDDGPWPSTGGWGSPDDSLQMLSPATYRRFVLPFHQRLYAAMTTGPRSMHLCGRSMQHYETLYRDLGITTIDGPGPFVDHAHYLETLGDDFAFNAQTDHSVLAYGSAAGIDAMMRGLLSPGAKQAGRFNVMGFITRDTPLANLELAYRLGREYGGIEGE